MTSDDTRALLICGVFYFSENFVRTRDLFGFCLLKQGGKSSERVQDFHGEDGIKSRSLI